LYGLSAITELLVHTKYWLAMVHLQHKLNANVVCGVIHGVI